MNLREYQTLANRTLAETGSLEMDLAHMTMGINSELSELEDACDLFNDVKISEEVADHAWYIANYCTLRGIELDQVKVSLYAPKSLSWYSQELTNLVKRLTIYGKDINPEIEQQFLGCILAKYYKILANGNIDLLRALSNNIAKLSIRYKEKFSKDEALLRNLDLEYKELEK